jgi:hypothetical protein
MTPGPSLFQKCEGSPREWEQAVSEGHNNFGYPVFRVPLLSMKKISTCLNLLLLVNLLFLSNTAPALTNDRRVDLKILPSLGYDADTGFGYGVSIVINSFRSPDRDPEMSMTCDFSASTGGEINPRVNFDFSRIPAGSQNLRLRGTGEYRIGLFDSFYGMGSTDKETGYDSGLESTHYYNYRSDTIRLRTIASMPVLWGKKKGLGRELCAAAGLSFAWSDYTNSTTPDGKIRASRLLSERPFGIDIGYHFSLITGIFYDSRDFEANPHQGAYDEFMMTVSA